MCDIAEIFNLNGARVSSTDLRQMTHSVAYRGPDSVGFFRNSFIGLGHRQLSPYDFVLE